MKRIEWLLSFGLMSLSLLATNAYAESPREEFKQMVEQLQKNPVDTALREKIIKLALTLKPAAATPKKTKSTRVELIGGNHETNWIDVVILLDAAGLVCGECLCRILPRGIQADGRAVAAESE